MNPQRRQLWRQGLWDANPGLVQLLGLCPLLAVTTSAVNGLGLGLATLLVLTMTNLVVSLLRHQLRPEIRIPAFVIIIATLVTLIDLLMQAWLHELSVRLGIFIPLIVTNCTILARAEAFASRHSPARALEDGLAQGLGFALILIVLGGLRELLGQGTLLAGADLLLGDWAAALTIRLAPEAWGFLLAALPPGAFITLGLLLAGHQAIVQRRARQSSQFKSNATRHGT
ncbi:MAG: electron transport complex subunit E [Wenzhouxiangella sp.]